MGYSWWNKNALGYGKNPIPEPEVGWETFTENYPVKTTMLQMEEKKLNFVNECIEKDIIRLSDTKRETGPIPTAGDLHIKSEWVKVVTDQIVEYAKRFPITLFQTDSKGQFPSLSLEVRECWGLTYRKGDSTKNHIHWPALWAFTYTVKGCFNCAPLTFPTSRNRISFRPKSGQLTLFPAWVQHEVPVQDCENERIVIAGNIYVD